MKIKYYQHIRFIGAVLLTFVLISSILLYIFDFDLYLKILTGLFSKDNYISRPNEAIVRVNSYLIFFILSWLFITTFFLNSFIDYLKSIRQNLIHIDKLEIILLFICILLFFLNSTTGFMNSLYQEDSLFESLTALFAFVSSLIFLSCIGQSLKKIKLIYISLAILFLLYGLEEISWGQRILVFETPELLGKINFQKETNFHNIRNMSI